MNKWYFLRFSLLAALLVLVGAGVVAGAIKSTEFPAPGVVDQITHDRGNLVTTVNNFGYIGGYSWAGRPSGRWPANSEHDYLAEMTFWIGGLDSANNILLANTTDDFNPMVNWSAASEPTDFRLSTDTTSYAYLANDTTGSGIGYPAYGWQVWDPVSEAWDYNQVYNTLDSNFYDGGPVGVQESICRFKDDGTGTAVMGLEITQTIRQWNFEYNKDMIFINFTIKNSSNIDYHDVAIGLYCDFDIGGNDPASGENGRLGDLVASDSALSLAWTYDQDGYDPGWGTLVSTGMMGTVVLSTPGDIGMTSFNTGQWETLPSNDAERYAMINNTEFDTSLPPTDQYYVQSVRGITLDAGETIEFNFALVAAPDEKFLLERAQTAKSLFEQFYVGPKPPQAPVLTAFSGDGKVELYWDQKPEESIEPTTGLKDFVEYLVFRSTDRGVTWGTLTLNPDQSVGPDYYPIAKIGPDAFGKYRHYYMEENLTNGMEYWYSIVAVDSGTYDLNLIDSLRNGKMSPETASNTARVIPRDDPVGFSQAKVNYIHSNSLNWDGQMRSINISVANEANLTGDDYRIAFTGDVNDTIVYMAVINETLDDTLLVDSLAPGRVVDHHSIIDGLQFNIKQPFYEYPDSNYQSIFARSGEASIKMLFVEKFDFDDPVDNFLNDVELRFTANGSVAYDWFSYAPMNVPFEIWNITDNIQINGWVVDWSGDGEYTVADEDYLIFANLPDSTANYPVTADSSYITWIMLMDVGSIPITGDVYTILGPGILSSDDQFTFTADKHAIIASTAKADLHKVHVVPNPYMGYAKWETGFVPKIQFVDLPEKCTIRIYTLAGEQISTLEHDGTGSEDWSLQSEAGRGIASGIYLFNVESEFGNYTGKFAIIR